MICCPLCVNARMLAYSLDQECAFINHCGPVLLLVAVAIMIFGVVSVLLFLVSPFLLSIGVVGFLVLSMLRTLIRRNIRVKYTVGVPTSWIGDFLVTIFCDSCSLCQQLRAIPVRNEHPP
jgi:Cys-rich protein (TIGR01571 family)